ncbi:MAG TPA: aldo/keto reductase [Gemmatimonadaceae bacterium]
MHAQLGLGLAALGRPGYVTLDHARDLGGRYKPVAMELRAHRVLDAALAAGIRYVDVARSYGRAEEFVASWLRARKIEQGVVTVASKWGYTYTAGWSTSAAQHEVKDHSLAAFERQLAESLERLNGQLSIYQIHSVTADSKTLEDGALIDAIARMRERGIKPGLSVSGPGQEAAIRRSIEVRRDGKRVFDSVQATWNLLERGAESALDDAHAAGMRVVIKETLANGRLTHSNQQEDRLLGPRISLIRDLAKDRHTNVETLAFAAALSRPWADVVLTGAATISQLASSVAARSFDYDAALDQEVHAATVPSADYWAVRASFGWN